MGAILAALQVLGYVGIVVGLVLLVLTSPKGPTQ